MPSESTPNPSPPARIAAGLLLLVAVLLFAGLIAAITLGLFGAQRVLAPYVLPESAGSTTGF